MLKENNGKYDPAKTELNHENYILCQVNNSNIQFNVTGEVTNY